MAKRDSINFFSFQYYTWVETHINQLSLDGFWNRSRDRSYSNLFRHQICFSVSENGSQDSQIVSTNFKIQSKFKLASASFLIKPLILIVIRWICRVPIGVVLGPIKVWSHSKRFPFCSTFRKRLRVRTE